MHTAVTWFGDPVELTAADARAIAAALLVLARRRAGGVGVAGGVADGPAGVPVRRAGAGHVAEGVRVRRAQW
jgi:hypothetical protein